MKTKLLIILCFGIFSANAQTTYDLDWYAGIGSNVDLTIDLGDTVRWTWGDTFPHSVTNLAGSTETFDSGIQSGIGYTYSYTFTLEGTNPYYCIVHGAASMSGTITVQNPLGLEDETFTSFNMYPNPSNSVLNLKLPQHITEGNVKVFSILGKEFLAKTFEATHSVELNVSNLAQGIYLVEVQSGGRSKTKQFVKF